MKSIPVLADEKSRGRLSDASLQAALQAIHTDGYVGLLNVADVSHLEAVRAQMEHDITAWNATAKDPVKGGNFTPSRRPEFLFGDILMNPIIAQVLGELLGREVSCGMYSSNVTMPGLGEQKLHVDAAPNKAGDDMTIPCFCVVVNFPLVDFTIENGATQLWPGTQHVMREPGEFWVNEKLEAARQTVAPPERAILPRGGALIRDIRLWHRGMVNHADHVRPMLAMILNGQFHPATDPVEKIPCVGPFPQSMRPFFTQSPAIYYNPQFVEEDLIPGPGHEPKIRAG
ncbi:MAG TPA: phytanoyl-CoA dioxygenase family protein [Tepidisphaeraceae bacterium]|jgi:hypothetical protein